MIKRAKAGEKTPKLVSHVARRIGQEHPEYSKERSYAIAAASLSRSGHRRPGKMELTAKGRKLSKKHSKHQGARPGWEKKGGLAKEALLKASDMWGSKGVPKWTGTELPKNTKIVHTRYEPKPIPKSESSASYAPLPTHIKGVLDDFFGGGSFSSPSTSTTTAGKILVRSK